MYFRIAGSCLCLELPGLFDFGFRIASGIGPKAGAIADALTRHLRCQTQKKTSDGAGRCVARCCSRVLSMIVRTRREVKWEGILSRMV